MKEVFKKINTVLDWCKYTCRDVVVLYTRKKSATAWLAIFSFTESSFFPIAPDLFLIALVLARPLRWAYYAFVTTAASAFGGLFGYALGALFYEAIGELLIALYGLENNVATISALFEKHAFLSIFAAAFTPIPYKAFTIAGGFFSINIVTFFLASILGRGLRFFLVGFCVKLFGKELKYLIYRYFNIASLIIIVLVLMVLFW